MHQRARQLSFEIQPNLHANVTHHHPYLPWSCEQSSSETDDLEVRWNSHDDGYFGEKGPCRVGGELHGSLSVSTE